MNRKSTKLVGWLSIVTVAIYATIWLSVNKTRRYANVDNRANELPLPDADKILSAAQSVPTVRLADGELRQQPVADGRGTNAASFAVNESALAQSSSRPSSCPSSRPTPGRMADIVVSYRHDLWQVQRLDGDDADGSELVVYSAFYDDRPIVGRRPWLRILGVLRITAKSAEQKLVCVIWNSRRVTKAEEEGDEASEDVVDIVDAEVIVTGRDHNIQGGRQYGQRLFSCQLSDDGNGRVAPTHVSISTDECDTTLTNLLPVQQRPSQQSSRAQGALEGRKAASGRWQHEFSVCVEQTFGSFRPEVVIEWIEAYRLFGVTKFNIYDANLTDPKTRNVFEYYARRGVVDLLKLPPSVDGDYSEEAVRLSSPTSLNDCMMRNMHSSRFIVVVDLDEIIVPRQHVNYTAMLAAVNVALGLNDSSAYHTYSFRNAYFFTYFPPDVTQPHFLRTARLRYRAPPSDYLFGAKSFVDPRRCLSVFNHYCWIQFDDAAHVAAGLSTQFGTSVDVSPDVALCQHYRSSCPLGDQVCSGLDRDRVLDDVMLKFRPTLERRVSSALRDIKWNFSPGGGGVVMT
jgi:hypothetical protein